MSAYRPYSVPDEDNESWNDDDSDIELIDYASGSESDCEIVAIHSREASAASSSTTSNNGQAQAHNPPSNDTIALPDIAIQQYKLNTGIVIKPGDTVELKDQSMQEQEAMHSGDFLRIKIIIMNMQTDQVRLRGYRLRRTKYLGQLFDWRLNELAMVLRLDENDSRLPLVAGMEDVDTREVKGVRECALTNKPYPFMSFRKDGLAAYPKSMNNNEIKRQMFHGGRLTCRVVHILYTSGVRNKPYGGVVRHLYSQEADTIKPLGHTLDPGISRTTSIPVDVGGELSASKRYRYARDNSPDFEILENSSTKRKTKHLLNQGRLVFGDVFCGAGGASQGAAQAGYDVQWGLDMDERALKAYSLNHPSAYALKMDAHDFPPKGISKQSWKVDVLHLSPPCCYWSPAHTINGRNDQANYEAIYTVGPILKKVKPRVATIEQTFGLATHKEHKGNFLMLLRDIDRAGYDVRYKIQDLSHYGLVQRRKRLLISAARRGTPLPPFPRPTHGTLGSGLKPFVHLDEALTHITRQGRRAINQNDPYHQPKLYSEPKPAYDPRTFLKGCITTSGTPAVHPSGTRAFTPRELSLFQSFPYIYHFTGTKREATKQIGNAFPPVMAQAMYQTIAKTLKAFDDGLIGAEDDLSDLDALLEQRDESRSQQRHRTESVFPSMSFVDGVLNGTNNSADRSTASGSRGKRRRREPSIPDPDDGVIYVPSDSE